MTEISERVKGPMVRPLTVKEREAGIHRILEDTRARLKTTQNPTERTELAEEERILSRNMRKQDARIAAKRRGTALRIGAAALLASTTLGTPIPQEVGEKIGNAGQVAGQTVGEVVGRGATKIDQRIGPEPALSMGQDRAIHQTGTKKAESELPDRTIESLDQSFKQPPATPLKAK